MQMRSGIEHWRKVRMTPPWVIKPSFKHLFNRNPNGLEHSNISIMSFSPVKLVRLCVSSRKNTTTSNEQLQHLCNLKSRPCKVK